MPATHTGTEAASRVPPQAANRSAILSSPIPTSIGTCH